ncbi:Bifunctional inhibitor/lipid-transfer protein/seed storage 2S albumin superfamily protein [Thalictrum thalictroides]|uniref:Bifunctional inhibitor/lipid-transfer protein/seed storage 2S albumin superfamily protein n=1 Tax=Thalictrum thalictroides TaxID=46969 RepID=A0A7J6WF37_THATH|nr:Bifunctional inhibitor/lipid-transfer protein/seed storage 2S albumin superfamily protein [Thalictrum thalictroides]
MKAVGTTKLVAVLVTLAIMASMMKQGTAQGCGTTFFSSLVQLIPCRPAVTAFSPIPPSESCCNAVRTLGQACLCVLVSGPPISGVDLNMAMQLPSKCNTNFAPCDMRK